MSEVQQLDNYRLIQQLSNNGLAEVYLAEDMFFNTLTAIKIFQQPLLEADLQACSLEVRKLAGLAHPNILPILKFGSEDAKFFLAMEYAPGDTLRQSYPVGKRLDPGLVLSLVKLIARALEYAHSQDIVHGDLKPENILLGPNGEVLLSDFGISRFLQARQQQLVQARDAASAYIAPEQLEGRTLPASDQYALALIASEWLLGVSPQEIHAGSFPGASGEENFSGINEVLTLAMNKDPDERFSSIQAFARAFEVVCAELASDHAPTIADENRFSTSINVEAPEIAQPAPYVAPASWQQAGPYSPAYSNPPFDNQPLPAAGAYGNPYQAAPPVAIGAYGNSYPSQPPVGMYGTPYPPQPVQPRSWRGLVIILVIVLLLLGGATTTVLAVGPGKVLHLVTGGSNAPQSVAPGSAVKTPVASPTPVPPTPTPTIPPTPTPTPTPTTEQQAQAVVVAYFTAINKKDYQTAYNQFVPGYLGDYQSFANGFSTSAHDDYQFGTLATQADGTVQVPTTLIATSTSAQQTTYQGYYTVGKQSDGTWKIISAHMSQV